MTCRAIDDRVSVRGCTYRSLSTATFHGAHLVTGCGADGGCDVI